MGSFGEDLKKAREKKGVTVETIATASKITARYLLAVEQENFDKLPGGVFRKNIVRSYARAAGLDEEVWVNRYLELTRVPEVPDEQDQAWIEFAENVGRSRGRSPRIRTSSLSRWAGALALVLLAIGMSWFAWGYVHNRAAAASRAQGISASLTAQSVPVAYKP
jgi:cytoskeleton protein RodZ